MSTFSDPDHADAGLVLGYFTAPAWAIALFGAMVALVGIGYFVWRARQPRRRASWPPTSMRRR